MSRSEFMRRVHGQFGRIGVTLYHGLTIVGMGAIVILVSQAARPAIDLSSNRPAAFGTIRHEGVSLFQSADDSENPRHRALAEYLSRKYKVAADATEQLVGAAHDAGQQVGLDPMLILAVMGIESGLNPIAESVMGAKGLMQVIPRHHQDKVEKHGGEESVLDPMTNILIGASILKDCIRRTGSMQAGLQLYAGALSDTSNQYALKVMAVMERLQQTLRRVDRQTSRPASA